MKANNGTDETEMNVIMTTFISEYIKIIFILIIVKFSEASILLCPVVWVLKDGH